MIHYCRRSQREVKNHTAQDALVFLHQVFVTAMLFKPRFQESIDDVFCKSLSASDDFFEDKALTDKISVATTVSTDAEKKNAQSIMYSS